MHAEHERRVAVSPPGQQSAVPRPVDCGAAADVARADHGVGASIDQSQQLAEYRWVVREVDVHRHDHVVALVESQCEALPVGAAQPLLAGAAQQLDLPEFAGDLLDQVAGAVGAVVVDDDDVNVRLRRADRGQQRPDVLTLVVRGEDDDGIYG
jgi:hypothetical protein